MWSRREHRQRHGGAARARHSRRRRIGTVSAAGNPLRDAATRHRPQRARRVPRDAVRPVRDVHGRQIAQLLGLGTGWNPGRTPCGPQCHGPRFPKVRMALVRPGGPLAHAADPGDEAETARRGAWIRALQEGREGVKRNPAKWGLGRVRWLV